MSTRHNRVAYWRRIHGLTQAEVSERLRVSRETVARWENGTHVPSQDVAERLARLLGTTVAQIFPREAMNRRA